MLKKIFIFILTLILTFLLLENFLSISGKIYSSKQTDLTNKNKTILCIGDSFTYGVGVKKQDSYPSLLQNKIKNIGFNYNIINAGMPGANSRIILKELPSLLKKYHPEIIILQFGTTNSWNFTYYDDFEKNYLQKLFNNLKTIKLLRQLTLLIEKKINFVPEDIKWPETNYYSLIENFNEKDQINISNYNYKQIIDTLELKKELKKYEKNLLLYTYIQLDEYKKVNNFLNKISKDEIYYLYKALTYIQKQDFKKAINILKTQIKKHPENISLCNVISFAYILKGKYRIAENWLKKSISLLPKQGSAYNIMGILYSDFYEDINLALSYYKKGIEICPWYPENYLEAIILYENYDIEKGIELAKKAVEKFPENIEFNSLYDYLKDKKNIAKDFENKIDGKKIKNNNDHEELAQYYLHSKKYKKALEYYRKTNNKGQIFMLESMLKGKNLQNIINNWLSKDAEKIILLCKKYTNNIIYMNYPEDNIFPVIDKCEELDIKVINNFDIFQNIYKSYEDKEVLFVPDRHLSKIGNNHVAETIISTLQKMNLIE